MASLSKVCRLLFRWEFIIGYGEIKKEIEMIQIVKQTEKEKFAMYSKLPKKELIQMLIAANEVVDRIHPIVYNAKHSQL